MTSVTFRSRSWLLVISMFLGAAVVARVAAQESVFVVEAHSGRVLITAESGKKRPVASLTKMATAIVVLDWAKVTGTDLGLETLVPSSAGVLGGANPMGLRPGDRITLRNALYSALLGSDNTAAQTMAHHVGFAMLRQRGQTGDPLKAFVEEMNVLARTLGMSRTKFANVHGMDNAGERGMSTASDMARLAIYAMRNPGFAFFVKQKSRKISFIQGTEERVFTVANTNELLGELDINGVKTGMTALAGQCLATSSERKPIVEDLPDGRNRMTRRQLVCVVLGSADRFGRTRFLMKDGWNRYEHWRKAGSPVADAAKELMVVPKVR
jgi:D-alanyl-D-alanine carboxypeptidase (penicillin-binding protein 5/6)